MVEAQNNDRLWTVIRWPPVSLEKKSFIRVARFPHLFRTFNYSSAPKRPTANNDDGSPKIGPGIPTKTYKQRRIKSDRAMRTPIVVGAVVSNQNMLLKAN